MPFEVKDLISADISEHSNYGVDWEAIKTDFTKVDNDKNLITFLLCLSVFLNFILFYMSIFGRRMRSEGIRWHVMFCCFFNFFQSVSISYIFIYTIDHR